MKAVLMPALGVAMTEGLVVRWLKQPGDSVAEGEPLLEIETDKSIVEVPSPATGLVGPLLFAEGDVVPTGVAVTHVSDGSTDPGLAGSAVAEAPVVVTDPPPSSSATSVRPAEQPTLEAGMRAPHTQSPRERRLARERAAAGSAVSSDAAAAAAGVGPDAQVTPARATGRYRTLIAAKVVESWTTIPHFSVAREVDAGAMVRLRTRYDAADRPGFTDLMVLALAHALRASGEPGSVDVGLAVATPNGVAIPVLRGVLDMDLGQLRREREVAVERARQDRLRPEDLRDAPRSTLSNLGTLGVDSFTGVIAVGQTSLLTVGRILARPFVSGATVAIRDSFHATLNADHRVLDGEEAARLLVDFVNAVEQISGIAGSGRQVMSATPVTTGYLPIDLDGIEVGRSRDWLRTMMLIRDFESRLDPLSMSGKIPGGLHLSIGQEAVAVGIAAGLEPQDLLACAHRSHHHAIAKGLSARGIMAELYGKATGCRGGRGGSMHLADLSLGFLGGNGIVGAGLGVAMGAALAAQVRGTDQVAVGIFGDGGANTGRTWESVNLASVWKLPLIIVCENNMYAVETQTALLTGGGSIARRAEGFGLPVRAVDGQDVAAMYRATAEARLRAAEGEGPTFIEASTYRYEGHSTGQVINYRTIEEVREWRDTRDPIQRLRLALDTSGALDEAGFETLLESVKAEVDDAIVFAEESPLPDPLDATRQVTAMDLGLGNL